MKLKKLNSGILTFVIVLTILFSLTLLYHINKTMFEPPQSVHIWRQTNSLSMAQNYYQDSLPFFQPEIHSQLSDGGHSGKAAAEFPVIYFIVAKLWKVFGCKIWIFRLVQIIILFTGMILLFFAFNQLIQNIFLAGFSSLLLFTSPMVVFYGPNFLPDVPALAFVFISWFFLICFIKKRKGLLLWWSSLFFCLAMLIKITSALSYIALGGWLLYELLLQKKEDRVLNFKIAQFLPFLLIIPIIVAWYYYVGYYNKLHGGHVSFFGIWPVWKMTHDQLSKILDALRNVYFKEMFMPITQYVTLALWLFLVFTMKKLKPVFRYFLIILPAGMFVELLLWFQVLEAHDYYTINLLIVFVAVWAIFFYRIKSCRFSKHPLFALVLLIFFIVNVFTCKERIEDRYTGWMNSMYEERMKALTEIEPLFKKLNIKRDDKVISIPDFTINASLYYMNRKGYTDFGTDFTKLDGFSKRIGQGAKYLIVNDSTMLRNEEIQPFLKKALGKYKNISIYDLRDLN